MFINICTYKSCCCQGKVFRCLVLRYVLFVQCYKDLYLLLLFYMYIKTFIWTSCYTKVSFQSSSDEENLDYRRNSVRISERPAVLRSIYLFANKIFRVINKIFTQLGFNNAPKNEEFLFVEFGDIRSKVIVTAYWCTEIWTTGWFWMLCFDPMLINIFNNVCLIKPCIWN